MTVTVVVMMTVTVTVTVKVTVKGIVIIRHYTLNNMKIHRVAPSVADPPQMKLHL